MKRFAILLWAASLAISIPLVLGFFGAAHPAFDAMAHFRAHLAVLLALAAVCLLAVRGQRMVGAVALALGIGAFATTLSTLPWTSDPALADDDTAPEYRLLHLNLRYNNDRPERALSLIGRFQPDIVMLNEVSATWRPRIEALRARYPYGIICPAPTRIGGVAILSRRPTAVGTEPTCRDRGAFAAATINFGGTMLDVAAIHLGWPWPFGQGWQIDTIAPILAAMREPALVAGDFNAAPWSHTVRRVAREGSLTIAGGIGPTWLHRDLPGVLRRWIGLPIDHVMTKGDIRIETPERGEWVGSDHLPVLVRFRFPPAEPASEPERQTVMAVADAG